MAMILMVSPFLMMVGLGLAFGGVCWIKRHRRSGHLTHITTSPRFRDFGKVGR